MAHSAVLEQYRCKNRCKIRAMLAEAYERRLHEKASCIATVRLFERHCTIIDAMTPQEQADFRLLDGVAISRIACVSGLSPDDVTSFVTWWGNTSADFAKYFLDWT